MRKALSEKAFFLGATTIIEEDVLFMAVEEGAKVSGKVSGITNFGAFVDLDDNQTGLVHISQISNSFVKDIHDVLTVGDEVTAKVVKIAPDGKIALSMKAIEERPTRSNPGDHEDHHDHHEGNRGHERHEHSHRENSAPRPRSQAGFKSHSSHHQNDDFNSMLASFMKESESRLSILKRQTDGKRGGRGGRRS